MMAGIKAQNTQPELRLRRALHAAGFRYRLHASHLPGAPDIVFPKAKAVVFVHGCFWHRHRGCRLTTTPASNAAFWTKKFEENVVRDKRNIDALRLLGWRVAIVWECGLRGAVTADTAACVGEWLKGGDELAEIPSA